MNQAKDKGDTMFRAKLLDDFSHCKHPRYIKRSPHFRAKIYECGLIISFPSLQRLEHEAYI